jgi:Xaa-Pro aminopeptidase
MEAQRQNRIISLQRRLADESLDGALVTDPDSIFYLSGYWGYASFVSCGRPNMLWIPKGNEPAIITPSMELEMCRSLSAVSKIHDWIDGINDEWRSPLRKVLDSSTIRKIAVEIAQIPGLVSGFISREWPGLPTIDLGRILGEMRMIKSEDEIRIMRQAGEVALAIAKAGENSIAVGTPEYEVSLAVMAGGTRKAAELLGGSDVDRILLANDSQSSDHAVRSRHLHGPPAADRQVHRRGPTRGPAGLPDICWRR